MPHGRYVRPSRLSGSLRSPKHSTTRRTRDRFVYRTRISPLGAHAQCARSIRTGRRTNLRVRHVKKCEPNPRQTRKVTHHLSAPSLSLGGSRFASFRAANERHSGPLFSRQSWAMAVLVSPASCCRYRPWWRSGSTLPTLRRRRQVLGPQVPGRPRFPVSIGSVASYSNSAGETIKIENRLDRKTGSMPTVRLAPHISVTQVGDPA